MGKVDAVVLTCEHGGNRIPAAYRSYFVRAKKVLASHRGYDIGALRLARHLGRILGVELEAATVSRLLVDLNRSLGHRGLFSEFLARAPQEEREAIIRTYYLPYRARVEKAVRGRLDGGAKVLHLAVHSFTPVLNRERRRADIGLLYDPSSAPERELCRRWRRALQQQVRWLRVRCNYPYRGRADGLGTYLRKRIGTSSYLAVELEVNQLHLGCGAPTKGAVVPALSQSLLGVLAGGQ